MIRVQTIESGSSGESAGFGSNARDQKSKLDLNVPKLLQVLFLVGCAVALGALNLLVAKLALVAGAIPFFLTLVMGAAFFTLWIALSFSPSHKRQASSFAQRTRTESCGDQDLLAGSWGDRQERVASLTCQLQRVQASVSLTPRLEAVVSKEIDAVVSEFVDLVDGSLFNPPLREDQALVVLRNRAGMSFGLSQVARLEDALLSAKGSTRVEGYWAS